MEKRHLSQQQTIIIETRNALFSLNSHLNSYQIEIEKDGCKGYIPTSQKIKNEFHSKQNIILGHVRVV